jgi:hypothetical protein
MITSKQGTLTLTIKEIPIPPKHIMLTMERNVADSHTSTQEYFFNQEEFIQFFEPLVKHYEELKHASIIQK